MSATDVPAGVKQNLMNAWSWSTFKGCHMCMCVWVGVWWGGGMDFTGALAYMSTHGLFIAH